MITKFSEEQYPCLFDFLTGTLKLNIAFSGGENYAFHYDRIAVPTCLPGGQSATR